MIFLEGTISILILLSWYTLLVVIDRLGIFRSSLVQVLLVIVSFTLYSLLVMGTISRFLV